MSRNITFFLAHGCSDIYTVMLLTVDEIVEPERQEAEIESAEWLSIDDALNRNVCMIIRISAILKCTFCTCISTSHTQTSLLSDFANWFEFQSFWTIHSSTMKYNWDLVYDNYSVQKTPSSSSLTYFFLFFHKIISFKIIVNALLSTFYIKRKTFINIWKQSYFLP